MKHIFDPSAVGTISIESAAWNAGIGIAKVYGYDFSDDCHSWMSEQVATYLNDSKSVLQ